MQHAHNLMPEILKVSFLKQLNFLFGIKTHLIGCLPKLTEQATFKNLQLAIAEVLEDTSRQMIALNTILSDLGRNNIPDSGLGNLMAEAERHVVFSKDDHYSSDMSIIFYMSIMENLQVGACRVLQVITEKPDYRRYEQAIKECFDVDDDNAGLFTIVANEYFGD